jgi:ubiquinone/menaquinone biosynthesis C-methylase UbiE
MTTSRWPKNPPPLTDLQKKQKADFLKLWHKVLPQRYGVIEKFNQESKILKTAGVKKGMKTLEIGAGLGEHLAHEDLTTQEYTALEIRPDFVEEIKKRFPKVQVMAADIEGKTNLPENFYDRVIAIHVLEHLRNLPVALDEIKRVLKTDGTFVVVIPCEGGLAYELARTVSARRLFQATYKSSYTPIIKNEHVNEAHEILEEIRRNFIVEERIFWPLRVPVVHTNLVIALACRPRA